MGSTAAMDSIVALARRRSIKVVEDAAQAHGAIYLRRRVGTWGDAGCFSFYPTKNLGGWGDGGCIVTDDADLAEHARLLRSHGEEPRYHHRIVGTTARLDALQASLLRVKLGRLDDRNEDRRRIACGAGRRAGRRGRPAADPCRRRRPRPSPVRRSRSRARRIATPPGSAGDRQRRPLSVPDSPDTGLRQPRHGAGKPAGRRATGRRDLHAAAVSDDVRRADLARGGSRPLVLGGRMITNQLRIAHPPVPPQRRGRRP